MTAGGIGDPEFPAPAAPSGPRVFAGMFGQVASVLGSQVLVYLFRSIASILTARLLGPEQRGVVVVATTIAAVVSSFACIGTGALVYNLSRASDPRAAIRTALGICARAVPCMLLVIVSLYGAVSVFGRHTLLKGLPQFLLLTSFVFCVGSLGTTLLINFLSGLQDFRWRNIVDLLPPLLLALLLIGYWRLALPLSAMGLLWVSILFSGVALAAGGWHILTRYRPGISWRLPEDWKQSYLQYGLKHYLAMLTQGLTYRLDGLLLKALQDNTAVGLYATAVSSAELLLFLPNAAAMVLCPSIAASREEERSPMTLLTLGSTLYLVLGGGAVFGVLLPWFIPTVYGSPYAPAIGAAEWLLPGMMALTIFRTLASAAAGMGRPEYTSYAALAALLGTTALDLLLIPRWGIVAASWASSAGYWLAAVLLLILYSRLTRASVWDVMRGLATQPAVRLRDYWRSRSFAGSEHAR